MKFLSLLSILFVGVFLSACDEVNTEAEQHIHSGISSHPIPAVKLTSMYANELQCPVLPNPPQQSIAVYPPEISAPALRPIILKACLKLEETTNQTIKLSEASQKVWQDFQCRVGYTPKADDYFPYEFQAITISHRYTKNSLPAKQIVQTLSEYLPRSEKIVELVEQQDLPPDCDVGLAIIPRVNSDMLNEIWHICYPTEGSFELLCSETTGCQCGNYHDKKYRNIFDNIKETF